LTVLAVVRPRNASTVVSESAFIDIQVVTPIVSAIVGFYFGKRTEAA